MIRKKTPVVVERDGVRMCVPYPQKTTVVGHRGAGSYVFYNPVTGTTSHGTMPALKPSGLRKKLGVAKSLVGHVLFECPRCQADAVMTTVGDGYKPKCSKCPHTTPVQKDEHLAATIWNVTP